MSSVDVRYEGHERPSCPRCVMATNDTDVLHVLGRRPFEGREHPCVLGEGRSRWWLASSMSSARVRAKDANIRASSASDHREGGARPGVLGERPSRWARGVDASLVGRGASSMREGTADARDLHGPFADASMRALRRAWSRAARGPPLRVALVAVVVYLGVQLLPGVEDVDVREVHTVERLPRRRV